MLNPNLYGRNTLSFPRYKDCCGYEMEQKHYVVILVQPVASKQSGCQVPWDPNGKIIFTRDISAWKGLRPRFKLPIFGASTSKTNPDWIKKGSSSFKMLSNDVYYAPISWGAPSKTVRSNCRLRLFKRLGQRLFRPPFVIQKWLAIVVQWKQRFG